MNSKTDKEKLEINKKKMYYITSRQEFQIQKLIKLYKKQVTFK